MSDRSKKTTEKLLQELIDEVRLLQRLIVASAANGRGGRALLDKYHPPSEEKPHG